LCIEHRATSVFLAEAGLLPVDIRQIIACGLNAQPEVFQVAGTVTGTVTGIAAGAPWPDGETARKGLKDPHICGFRLPF